MSLLSHARTASIKETILDSQEIAIQATSYQMVMAYHVEDLKSERNGKWKFYLQDFITNLIESERTKIQNLMIGGILFNQATNEEIESKINSEILIIENGIR